MGPLAIFNLAILGLRGQLRMGRKIAQGNRWVARKALARLPMSDERRTRYSGRLDRGAAKLDHFYERGTHFVDKFAKTTGMGTIPGTLTLGLGSLAKSGKLVPLLKHIPMTDARKLTVASKAIRATAKYDRVVTKANRFIPRGFKIATTKATRRAAIKALNPKTAVAATTAAVGGKIALKQVIKTGAKRLKDPRNYVNMGPDGLMNAGLGYLQTGDASVAAGAFVTPEGRMVGGIAGLATKHFGGRAGKALDRRLGDNPEDPRHQIGVRGRVNRSLARVHTGANHAAGHATRLTGVDDMASLAAHATNLGVHSHAGIANGSFKQAEHLQHLKDVAKGNKDSYVNEEFLAMMRHAQQPGARDLTPEALNENVQRESGPRTHFKRTAARAADKARQLVGR